VTKNELDESVSMMSSRLKGAVAPYKDKSLVWDHDYEGEVKKVIPKSGGKGYTVYVKTVEPAQVGDKLCYDEETEILTKAGWKFIKDLDIDDYVATLNPLNDKLEYHQPTKLHKYETGGDMYRVCNNEIDLLVTMDHNMYVKDFDVYELKPAREIVGKDVFYKKLNEENNLIDVHIPNETKYNPFTFEQVIKSYTRPVYCLTVRNHIVYVRRGRLVVLKLIIKRI
jgi:hypothetical protein